MTHHTGMGMGYDDSLGPFALLTAAPLARVTPQVFRLFCQVAGGDSESAIERVSTGRLDFQR